jgi:hypothetical protein
MSNLTPGTNLCHCSGCGLDFKSVSAFDSHRTGRHGPERRCLTEQELRDKGFEPNDKGFWRKPR